MKLEHLTRPTPPWLHALISSPADAAEAVRRLERSASVVARFVRGVKSLTKGALCDEMSAALQFPPYWGENWDALRDCLADPVWFDERPLVICFLDGTQLLEASGADQRRDLLTVLRDVAQLRNEPGKGKSPRPFHVVWQADARHEAELERHWPGLRRVER
jgi:RNAse (barnase) inhibitor barstar